MRFPHVELDGNSTFAAQKVNKHAYVTTLEVHFFKPGSLRSSNIAN